MHRCGGDRLWLLDEQSLSPRWHEVRGHRAIGVVYSPDYDTFINGRCRPGVGRLPFRQAGRFKPSAEHRRQQ
jgi:hypothetical protein